MVNGKSVIRFTIGIIMIMCFCVSCSPTPPKPSEKTIKKIIITIELEINSQSKKLYKHIKYKTFTITKKFISRKNGRYCISVDYEIEYKYHKNRYFTTIDRNDCHFSFEKKGKKWYGERGWGPGEEQ